MNNEEQSKFIKGLQIALQKERATHRTYLALAKKESNEARRKALMGLAETEAGHAERWATRLKELGANVPINRESFREKIWRWVLVQSGTDNALKRLESNEEDDTEMYASLVKSAPTDADRVSVNEVLHDEETHSGAFQRTSQSPNAPVGPQAMLDIILHRESWHRRGGGWIGQAIYGANDGLGSVFGIVTGVAGATAGGPAVLIAGLAGMLASALSMGSGAYLATKTEREVQEAELRRERRELQTHPEEEEEELALFYQLKGVPEDEARDSCITIDRSTRIRAQDFGKRRTGTIRAVISKSMARSIVCHALNRDRSIHSDHSVFLRQRLRSHHCLVCNQHACPFRHRRVQDHCDRFESMEERRGDDHHWLGRSAHHIWIGPGLRVNNKIGEYPLTSGRTGVILLVIRNLQNEKPDDQIHTQRFSKDFLE